MIKPLILVVEDNELNLRLYYTILQSKGYRVNNARDGVTGVAVVKATLPDLVVMDIQLPKMDGLTATRIIKEEPSTAGIPVVIVTSYAMQEDREKGLQWGCDCYLTKPVNYKEFLEVIDNLLYRSKANNRLKEVR